MQIWNYNKKMEITENEDPLNTLVYNAPPPKSLNSWNQIIIPKQETAVPKTCNHDPRKKSGWCKQNNLIPWNRESQPPPPPKNLNSWKQETLSPLKMVRILSAGNYEKNWVEGLLLESFSVFPIMWTPTGSCPSQALPPGHNPLMIETRQQHKHEPNRKLNKHLYSYASSRHTHVTPLLHCSVTISSRKRRKNLLTVKQ